MLALTNPLYTLFLRIRTMRNRTTNPEYAAELEPIPWRGPLALAIVACLPFLIATSIFLVPSGMGGVRVSQILFLDEIGDMPHAMQAKLLRVLEGSGVERIDSDKPTPVDVRVIVAKHRNLESLVASGEFRRDLFHRVVIFPLELPPLRSRTEDLPALVNHFVLQVCAQNN